MLTLEYAKDPVFNSADHNQIHLTVKFQEFGFEMPFNATHDDVEAHGVDIFNRAKAGEFGVVAPYVEPETQPQPISQGAQTL